MDLNELANCFEAESKQENIWESVTHDWMVENINLLEASLQQYVKTFYSSTYAAVGSAPTVYQDLMYMGLQNCTLFQEQIVAAGLLPTVTANWGKLNEGENAMIEYRLKPQARHPGGVSRYFRVCPFLFQ